MRIGQGYDVHRLVEGRDLILAGMKIPFEKGLLGHSDADVLTHALCDALLGAANLGDIGLHFPDKDERYRGISSIILLKEVNKLLKERNYKIENVDCTVIADKPKLRSYIDAMRANLAEALEIDADRVSIKATTQEGLGFAGRGEGIASLAVCLLS